MRGASILWSRNDLPGHEYLRITPDGPRWILSGVALFQHETLPCSLTYRIRCDSRWFTTHVEVAGWVGDREVAVTIVADEVRRWTMNGEMCPVIEGALDIDLNFSPSTNMLPIRRLGLQVGQRAEVVAAWLRFPGFTLEPLTQVYTRTGELAYVYESAGGSFVADLKVDPKGVPLAYANIWTARAAT